MKVSTKMTLKLYIKKQGLARNALDYTKSTK